MHCVACVLILAHGVLARDCFNASNSRCNAALRHNLAEADVTGSPDMRAAAEFLAEIRNHYNANVGAILFSEQCHCTGGDGLIERHHVRGDFGISQDLFVDQPFNFGDLRGVDGGVVTEIETKPWRLDDAAGLFDMGAKNLAESGVE
jgi:hypothetical protein